MSLALATLGTLLVGMVLGSGTAPAEAEAPTPVSVALDWQAPAACPDGAHVAATIARLVGRPVETTSQSPTRARAVVRARGEGFVLELWARHGDAEDRRTIHAPHCAALADATALVLAVALRPLDVVAALSPRAPLAADDSLAVEPPSVPPVVAAAAGVRTDPRSRADHPTSEPSPTPARATALQGALAATIGPGLGVLPGVAAELRAAAALRGRGWRVEATGMYWFPRVSPSTSTLAVEVGLGGGGLRGCAELRRRRLEVPLCAGAELGAMRGRGRGSGVLPRASSSLWAAVHAGPGITWALGSWVALRLSVDAIVALRQPAFDLRVAGERRELFRAPPVGGRAALGIELRWP
jgi:hypothetical protein